MLLKEFVFFGVIAACYAESILIQPRVVGGVPVEIEDFPYVVSVQAPGPKGRTHFSTGTILNSYWILTTASRIKYFDSPRAIQIRTGTTQSDNAVGVDYGVQEKVQHPSYNPDLFEFDLALLKVDPAIDFTGKTATIGLYSEDSVAANLTGTLVGWGETYVDSLKSSRLYSVQLQTVGTIDGQNLAVTVPDPNVCYSDVGGPFVVDNLVLGISTVNRLGCENTDQYVTRFDANTLKWINSVIFT